MFLSREEEKCLIVKDPFDKYIYELQERHQRFTINTYV